MCGVRHSCGRQRSLRQPALDLGKPAESCFPKKKGKIGRPVIAEGEVREHSGLQEHGEVCQAIVASLNVLQEAAGLKAP